METHTTPRDRRRGFSLLAVVLVLVNSAAIWGQAGWALDHIVPPGWHWLAGLALSLGFAAALELIGVFLATMADESESRDLPAGGVRLMSYAVGLFSGALNFSHFLGVTFAAAVAFGFLSAVSPFLWGIYARVRRGRPVAPSRRFWHPARSVALIRFMAWEGIPRELDGIRAMAPPPALSADPETPVSPAPEVHPVPPPQPAEPEHVTPGPAAEPPAVPKPDSQRRPQAVHTRAGRVLSGPELKADAVALVRAEGLSNAGLAQRYAPPLPAWRAREFVSEARKPVNGHAPVTTIRGMP